MRIFGMKFVGFGNNKHKFTTFDISRFRDEEISKGIVVMNPTTSRDNTKNLSRHKSAEHRTSKTAEYRRKQDTLLDDIQLNERCLEPELDSGLMNKGWMSE